MSLKSRVLVIRRNILFHWTADRKFSRITSSVRSRPRSQQSYTTGITSGIHKIKSWRSLQSSLTSSNLKTCSYVNHSFKDVTTQCSVLFRSARTNNKQLIQVQKKRSHQRFHKCFTSELRVHSWDFSLLAQLLLAPQLCLLTQISPHTATPVIVFTRFCSCHIIPTLLIRPLPLYK